MKKAEGQNPFILDSKPPTADLKAFLLGENRFAALKKQLPAEADSLFLELEKECKERFALYQKLAKLWLVSYLFLQSLSQLTLTAPFTQGSQGEGGLSWQLPLHKGAKVRVELSWQLPLHKGAKVRGRTKLTAL